MALRAIVVDDSRAMRTMLRRILQEIGIVVVAEAGDGRDALAKFTETGPIELALLDWNMPVMNGLELLCALRADVSYASMRIMLVTTETEASQILRALDSGADEYLIKPFHKEALHDKLSLMGLLE
jgi:two-component system chemotaxis response regulator CheY